MDADEEIVEGLIDVELLVAVVLGAINADRADNLVQHNSELTGAKYYEELINTHNVNRFHNVARMDKATFFLLHKLLKDVGGLRDSMYISAVVSSNMSNIFRNIFFTEQCFLKNEDP